MILISIGSEVYDQTRLEQLIAERDALLAFKSYVHKRLDDAGVPVDPDSPHKAAGCRIGGRLDILIAQRDAPPEACVIFKSKRVRRNG